MLRETDWPLLRRRRYRKQLAIPARWRKVLNEKIFQIKMFEFKIRAKKLAISILTQCDGLPG